MATTRWLNATRGSHAGRRFRIRQRLLIGRSANTDIQLLEGGVSRQHTCIVEADDGRLILMDLGSKNGTLVNGEAAVRADLELGAEIGVGDSVFVLVEGDAPPDDDGDADDIKLASGVAEEHTKLLDAVPGDVEGSGATPGDCGSPMHAVAVCSRWAFCPACGNGTK